MKKFTLVALAVIATALFGTFNANAQEFVEPEQAFDVLQIGMLRSVVTNQDTTPVYGLRFGLPICGGKAPVNGVDFAIIGSQSDIVNGFQYGTFFTIDKDFCGLRIACVNAGEKTAGVEIAAANLTKESTLQIGAFNMAKKGFQIGIINVMEDAVLPVMILFNFAF